MNKRWFEMSEAELENDLTTSAVNGLTKKAAAARRKRNGGNYIFRLPHGSFASYFKEIFSYLRIHDLCTLHLLGTHVIALQ